MLTLDGAIQHCHEKAEELREKAEGHLLLGEYSVEDFLTCKNCKDKNIKIRRAYRKDYCEMWEYCPKCGAKFVKRKRGRK